MNNHWTERTLTLFGLTLFFFLDRRGIFTRWQIGAKLLGYTLGIGDWFGNCSNGLFLHLHLSHSTLQLHHKQLTTSIHFNAWRKTLTYTDGRNPRVTPNQRLQDIRNGRARYITKLRPRLSWNSEHIAHLWGTPQEADHGTCYIYKGPLGLHQLV